MVERREPAARPRLVLAMLLLVYTFNFLDRQVLGILAQPIKADLKLSDTELGALGGIAFALLYTTLGVPFAIVADRTSRSWVVTISLTIWSGFTALCGLATGFWQLFLCRVGVGVGEAGGVAPSYALVSDYFPPEKRARAFSIYSLGIPIGQGAGALLGAGIASAIEWRTAFVVLGLAGVVVAPLFRWVVRDKPDTAADRSQPPYRASVAFRILAAKSSFWLMAFAASCSSLCGYGLAFWIPSILMRNFGFSLMTTGAFLGSILIVGGCSAMLAGGWLADRAGAGDRGSYARISAIAWLATGPLFAAGLLSHSPLIAWLFLLPATGLNLLWLGPVTTAVQNLAPPAMRATASAMFLFVNNFIGLGLGSLLMGIVSDGMKLRFGNDALKYAAVSMLGFFVLAGVLMLLAVRPLRRDWFVATA